jgi:hypothetical protein
MKAKGGFLLMESFLRHIQVTSRKKNGKAQQVYLMGRESELKLESLSWATPRPVIQLTNSHRIS